MAVADRQPGQHYGCHNRAPYATSYFAPDRVYKPDGTYHTILRRIPFQNSVLCKYDRWADDYGCDRVPHQTSVLCKYDLWHSDWGCLECKWAGGQVPSAKKLFKNEECND